MEKIDTDYKRRPWRIEAKRCKMCKPLRFVCGRRTDVVTWYDKLLKKGHISCRLYSMFPVYGSSERHVEYPYQRISSFWTTCFTWHLRPVFTSPEKFESGVFTLRTHHLCFRPRYAGEIATLHDWLKKSRATFSSNQKSNKNHSHLFSRALRQLHLIPLSFDWFTGLSVPSVIG